MALLERVSTLVRANLNDLIDRAEHPEKMIKQVMLDMENQLMQVKTQVAIAIADEHLLRKKQKENEEKAAEWTRKAEIAVDKKQDDLARAALERSLASQQMADSFAQQSADQKQQVETLKSALRKLEQKLAEAQAKSELLMAQHRRARALGRATDARMAMGGGPASAALDRMNSKVSRTEAISNAKAELAGDNIEDRLHALGREDEIEKLLSELKAAAGRVVRAACLLLAAQIAFAQGGVEGNWAGTLDAGAVKLRLALKLARAADGSLTGTLDSLDQGAKDLPITTARQNGASVSFELRQIGGSFQGTLAGQQLTGTWKQGGGAMPLAFHRVASVPVLRRPQEPKKPYPYHEEEISYENKAGAAKLAGTLTTPADGRVAAAVLLITGSGQQDRDESLMGHRPFLVLADHLTRKGLAVLRVDDRGIGGSTGELRSATSEDFAGDVRAGVEYLKSRGFARIGLVGHSEGGMIASMVAAGSKDVAFIVLLAGTGVTGDQVVYEQAAAMARAAGASAAAVAQNHALQEQMITIIRREADPAARAARLVELKSQLNVVNPNITAQFEMAATPWFRFFMLHDPAADLKRVTCPVLAMDGELDLQVSAAQNLPAIEQALKAGGNRDVTILKLPRLNHLFQTAKTGSPAEYGQIEETMAPAALDAISGWILKTVTSPGKL